MTLRAIADAAAAHGLTAAALRADPAEAPGARTAVLLAADGARTWAAFRAAPEAQDGALDPLDRWSARVAGALAAQFGGRAILPSDGPPYAPFLRWAARAEPVWPSRLGMMLHAERGLWTSWRAALVFAEDLGPPPAASPGPRPCDPCPAPCLRACPVGAFAETPDGPRYDVPACAAHLAAPEGEDCRANGCRARRACPVGAAFRPAPEQAAFHIAAFRRAHPAPGGPTPDEAGPG